MSGTRSKTKNRGQSQMEEEMSSSQLTVEHLEATLNKFFTKAQEQSKEHFQRLEHQLTTIQETLNKHAQDIEKQRTDISAMQSRVNKNEDTLSGFGDALSQLESKLVSLEDRSRRDNLRIVNIKEGEEKNNAVAYLTASLPKWFPGLAESSLELMRAHRIGTWRPSSPKPRVMIVKFLRFSDRDRVLNESRRSTVRVAGQPIRFAPDFSDITAKKRRPCYALMNRARTMGFKAFLLYPATIKLTNSSVGQQLFENPAAAEKFLSDYETSKSK